MTDIVAYCGLPPSPATLLARWNFDPLLAVALAGLAGLHLARLHQKGAALSLPALGWTIAAFCFLSPLCALSVSLFSARIGQHMILALVAAPLIALGLPSRGSIRGLSSAATLFAAALWFWHMPAPYSATFRSDLVYWSMHISLFGSAILLWQGLLDVRPERALPVLAAGAASSIQMGLLGAVFAMSTRPLFAVHLTTAPTWGMTPLADQQLGGLLMWVPGLLFFLLAAARTVHPLLKPSGFAGN